MRRVALAVAIATAGCIDRPNPAFDGDGSEDDGGAGCTRERFAFAVLADAPADEDAALARVLGELAARGDIAMVFGAGDTGLVRLTAAAAATSRPPGACASEPLAVFPAVGVDEIADGDGLTQWATEHASGWTDAAASSPLASQLAALTAFERGPIAIEHDGASTPIPPGAIYGFAYGDAMFTVLDTHERGTDGGAGIRDGNAVDDPESSQIDWLRARLTARDRPLHFAVGHVPLVAPCYAMPPLCPGDAPPGWFDDPDPLYTAELAATLADGGTTAYLHGHDNVPARLLVDGAAAVLDQRTVWDVLDGPDDPARWQPLLGPDRLWQIDVGTVGSGGTSYVVVTVAPEAVTYELFVIAPEAATMRFDGWTVAR